MFEGLRVLVLLCSPLKPNWKVITIQIQQKKKKHLQIQDVSHFKQNHILTAVLCINHKPLSVQPMKSSFWSTFYISPQKWAQTHTHQFKTIEKQHHTHNRWLTQSLWPGQVKSRLWWCHKEEEQGRLEKGRKDDTHTRTHPMLSWSPTQCHHFFKNLTHTAD